jgi:hypothetical protein
MPAKTLKINPENIRKHRSARCWNEGQPRPAPVLRIGERAMIFNLDLKWSNPRAYIPTCILKRVSGAGGSSMDRFTLPPCRATYRQTLQGDEWAMNPETRLLAGK